MSLPLFQYEYNQYSDCYNAIPALNPELPPDFFNSPVICSCERDGCTKYIGKEFYAETKKRVTGLYNEPVELCIPADFTSSNGKQSNTLEWFRSLLWWENVDCFVIKNTRTGATAQVKRSDYGQFFR